MFSTISRISANIDNMLGYSQLRKEPYDKLIPPVIVTAVMGAWTLLVANYAYTKPHTYNPDKNPEDYALKICFTAISISMFATSAIILTAICHKIIIGSANPDLKNNAPSINPTTIEQKQAESSTLKNKELLLPIDPIFDAHLRQVFSSQVQIQQMLDFEGHKVLIIYNPEFKQKPVKVGGITVHNSIILVSEKSIPNQIMKYLISKFPPDCTHSTLCFGSINGKPTFSFFGYEC